MSHTMLYLTNERGQMLDGYLRDAQSVADAIQQGTTGSAAPILDYVTQARALLATDMDRGDKLAAFNTDTPAVIALRANVKQWVDGPVSAVRAMLGAGGSTRSQGDCVAELVVAAVIQMAYPEPWADVVDVPPVVVADQAKN